MTEKDYKVLKKHYGENFAKLCRELFPTLLEKEGLLPNLILSKFYPNHYLYEDIINTNNIAEFKNYIYSFIDVEQKKIKTNKTVNELFSIAGYNFYECKSEEDIQSFKKYYKSNEKLCTFHGGRLENCYVFFAIKKNVDDIRRENFKNPKRQDEYGTSVISIQFSKGDINTLSIKNRYNHTVNNPDATFSNNLENIIPGLTEAFEREYHLNINQNETKEFELDNYVKANDGKYYRYNYEIRNVYYCMDNMIIDNFEVYNLEKERYLLIDYFIVDLKDKTIELFDFVRYYDGFLQSFKEIQNIEVKKIKESSNKRLIIKMNHMEDIIIEIDKFGNIIKYEDSNLKIADSNFLQFNQTLKEINCPNLESVKDCFLCNNEALEKIKFSKLISIGNNFLFNNEKLNEIEMPNLKSVGYHFLIWNQKLTVIKLPQLETIGDDFLNHNTKIQNMNLPNLINVGKSFLMNNEALKKLNLPNLKKVERNFLYRNKIIDDIYLPNLETVKDNFLCFNRELRKIDLPKLKDAGANFLKFNQEVCELNCPELISVKKNFLEYNLLLKSISLPELIKDGNDFLGKNKILEYVDLPSLMQIEDNFLYSNTELKSIDLPNLKYMTVNFLYMNKKIGNINLSNTESEFYPKKLEKNK